MENKNHNERTLAYRSACLIKNEDIAKIGGGSATGTTVYTTKQTADNRGNWDTGADVQWD